MKLLRTLRNSTIALMATITFAGSASAEMLDAQEIQELLEHPIMVDNSELSLDPSTQAEQIEAMIEVVFEPLESVIPGIVDKMNDIGVCESGLQHLDENGNIILNFETKRAKGVFQIVPNPHDRTSGEMGLDTDQANTHIVYARFLVQDRVRMGDGPYTDWVCA
jgi:hypothetical protein